MSLYCYHSLSAGLPKKPSVQPFVINEMSVEGKLLAKPDKQVRQGFIFKHLVTSDMPVSVSIQIESKSEPKPLPKIRLIESSFDLANHLKNFQPRYESYMPSPFKQSDTIITSQPVVLNLSNTGTQNSLLTKGDIKTSALTIP